MVVDEKPDRDELPLVRNKLGTKSKPQNKMDEQELVPTVAADERELIPTGLSASPGLYRRFLGWAKGGLYLRSRTLAFLLRGR
jgi:hypothetical protein